MMAEYKLESDGPQKCICCFDGGSLRCGMRSSLTSTCALIEKEIINANCPRRNSFVDDYLRRHLLIKVMH